MTCHIQSKRPVQLNVLLPKNGCTSDLKLYHHPAGGEQKSVFSCDWDEKADTYDCGSSYPGVTWHQADPNNVVINVPETANMNEEEFRYQYSCHDAIESGRCLTPAVNLDTGEFWSVVYFTESITLDVFPVSTYPVDITTKSNIAEVTSETFSSTTINNFQENSEHFGNEAITITAVTCGIVILILVLIVTFLLCKNRLLKRSIKKEKQETASKNVAVNTTSIPLETVVDDTTNLHSAFADSGCVSNAMSTNHTTPMLSRYDSYSDLSI